MPNSPPVPKSPPVPHGPPQPAIQFTMSDDALVTFGPPVGPDALSFHDVGYMPVNAITIAGHVPGAVSKALSGAGLSGMFVQYSGDGVQHFANGLPTTANYTDLHYQLIGYTGHASFGHATDGSPTVSGLIKEVVLAQGDLISGQLAFNASGGIGGEVDVSMQVAGLKKIGSMDITVQHPAADIGHTATGGLTLSNGALVGTFIPPHGS